MANALYYASDHLPVYADFVSLSSTNTDSQTISASNFILQNFPNPFNPSTTIYFTAENTENADLIIYNIKGKKIRQYSIFNNQSSIIWNGTDDNGKVVSSGVYFYRLKSGRYTSTKKMILMK